MTGHCRNIWNAGLVNFAEVALNTKMKIGTQTCRSVLCVYVVVVVC